MQKLTKTFIELRNCDGTNAKIEFVKNHKDDVEFIESLKFLLDSSIVTGISDKKYNKYEMNDVFTQDECVSISTVFDYLKSHNTGKDEDIYRIKKCECIWCTCDEDREVFKGLVTKNLQLGCDVKNCNKAIPNLIPTFEVALCSKLSDYPNALDGNTEWEINCKIDGGRCVAIKENGKTRLISRQGKVWEGLIEVEDAINNLSEDNIVLDGELTITDFMNYPSDEVYKSTMKIISSKEKNKSGITLNVFDILTLDEWNNGCKTIQKDRRIHLDKLLSENKSKSLYCVPAIYIGKDPNKVSELMKDVVEPNDWEGLVLKDTSKFYEHKRCKSWLKVKSFDEMDLIIKDVEEGTNSNKGKLGALICEIEHPSFGHIEVKVGSGYNEYERCEFFNIKNELIGRIISVSYFEVTENTTTHIKSLRFPVFLELKEKGQEPNN